MQQLGGQHLYDAIHTQLKQNGAASLWDTAKDKPAPQQKNVLPQSKSSNHGRTAIAKRNLPVDTGK
ncbi:hypothetical protein P3T76_015393 [Phytophthora citrophthora]|uniref:Uncharacterized protein n=1 Tax=Phytophthora citrophthora TaxID=4793 RepID=A0AAD9FZI8_9STRA|nr:hypothetical protein P3T76_015393 [Phytophthora citrophthora]